MLTILLIAAIATLTVKYNRAKIESVFYWFKDKVKSLFGGK